MVIPAKIMNYVRYQSYQSSALSLGNVAFHLTKNIKQATEYIN